MRFLLYSLVSSNSFVLPINPFLIFFFHLNLFDGVCFQYSQVFVRFLFYDHCNFFLALVVLFLPSRVVSRFSLLAWRIFLFWIPMSWLDIPTARIRVSSSFSFLANSFILSMNIRWLIFSSDLVSFYPLVHFLIMWISGIIAIPNYNGVDAFPRKISLWSCTTAKLFSPAFSFTL